MTHDTKNIPAGAVHGIVNRRALIQAIAILKKHVPAASPIPLERALVFYPLASAGKYLLSIRTLEISIAIELEGEFKAGDGRPELIADIYRMDKILRAMDDDVVNLWQDNKFVVTVKGNHGQFQTPGHATGIETPGYVTDTEDTPRTFSLDADDIRDIAVASKFTGNDDLRINLQHVYIDKGMYVGTDANFMCYGHLSNPEANGVLLHSDIIPLLQKMSEPLTFRVHNTSVHVDGQHMRIMFRKSDEKFPEWGAVVPKQLSGIGPQHPSEAAPVLSVELNRQSLLDGLKRLVAAHPERYQHMTHFEFLGQRLILHMDDLELGTESIVTLIGNPGAWNNMQAQDYTIGFNAKLIIAILSNIDATYITMNMAETNNRAAIITTGFRREFLCMPMMIDNYADPGKKPKRLGGSTEKITAAEKSQAKETITDNMPGKDAEA